MRISRSQIHIVLWNLLLRFRFICRARSVRHNGFGTWRLEKLNIGYAIVAGGYGFSSFGLPWPNSCQEGELGSRSTSKRAQSVQVSDASSPMLHI